MLIFPIVIKERLFMPLLSDLSWLSVMLVIKFPYLGRTYIPQMPFSLYTHTLLTNSQPQKMLH